MALTDSSREVRVVSALHAFASWGGSMQLEDTPVKWPGGSARWDQLRLVILTSDLRTLPDPSALEGVAVVVTPLDLIVQLETGPESDTIVVLEGAYAGCVELKLVLLDLYPWVRVVDGDPESSPAVTGRKSRGWVRRSDPRDPDRYSPVPAFARATR